MTEYHEQVAVVKYLDILKAQGKIVIFSAVPNNTWTTSWSQKTKQRMEGVRRGVPDLIIVGPKSVLFLEMKKKKGGTVSDPQKEWQKALQDVGGNVGHVICKGFDEAKLAIDKHFG